MQVNDVVESSESKSPTLLDHEKAKKPGTWGELKYCERCREVLPPHYTLRFCQQCRKETLDEYFSRRKSPEW